MREARLISGSKRRTARLRTGRDRTTPRTEHSVDARSLQASPPGGNEANNSGTSAHFLNFLQYLGRAHLESREARHSERLDLT